MRLFALFCASWLAASWGAEIPKIAFISGEYEYDSRRTLPEFARQLERDYLVETFVLERPDDPKIESISGLDKLEKAGLVVLFVRRMTLPEEQLNAIKQYIRSGKPLVGLRTASHAFENWKEFDAQVLGGNYQNHHGNAFKPRITIAPEARGHPILRGFSEYVSSGSLYKNSPLRAGAKPLLLGTIEGKPPEPVAWTHEFNHSRVFYTSLGHPDDFKQESFRALVRNGMEWALNQPLRKRSN